LNNSACEYIKFLTNLKKDLSKNIRFDIDQLLWDYKKILDYRNEQSKGRIDWQSIKAYHLGIIPSKVKEELISNSFIDPKINLKRTGLYTDVIVFDDIVGNLISKN